MKEYWNLMTRPDGMSKKDYICLLWSEIAVLLFLLLFNSLTGASLYLLCANAAISVIYAVIYIDWSAVEE